jgi:hypothetical protein
VVVMIVVIMIMIMMRLLLVLDQHRAAIAREPCDLALRWLNLALKRDRIAHMKGDFIGAFRRDVSKYGALRRLNDEAMCANRWRIFPETARDGRA